MITLQDIRLRITKKLFLYTLLLNSVVALSLMERSDLDSGKIFISDLIFSQFIGITCLFCVYIAFHVFKTGKLKHQILIALGAILIGSIVAVAARGISPADNMFAYVRNMSKSLIFGSVFIFIFVSLEKISMANALIAEEKIKSLDLEKRAVETELQLLQSHTEPHFLFNTLSNVISLLDAEPQKAKSMLRDFVDFLRTSMSVRQSGVIPVSQEMELIRCYLSVLKTRMGKRLVYTIDADDAVLGHRIPPLLIQPLVENAVKHGLEPKTEGGRIVIRGSREDDIIRIEVSDSGVGINANKSGNGTGLSNIRKRLELLYGDKGRLVIRENSPSGVSAVIEMSYGKD
jgi:sensor histidine kinase YesM